MKFFLSIFVLLLAGCATGKTTAELAADAAAAHVTKRDKPPCTMSKTAPEPPKGAVSNTDAARYTVGVLGAYGQLAKANDKCATWAFGQRKR